MRLILLHVSLLVICTEAAADTREGYDAYTAANYKAAVGEFRKSAQQGDALALFYLGKSYYNGRGVVHDFAEGIKWYKQSAGKGQVKAQETWVACIFSASDHFAASAQFCATQAMKWYGLAIAAGKGRTARANPLGLDAMGRQRGSVGRGAGAHVDQPCLLFNFRRRTRARRKRARFHRVEAHARSTC